jgi:23S rRNA pseudouridine1911/1915/1917 synthase
LSVRSERSLVADRGDAGRRLDLVIRRHLSDLTRATRTRIQIWIDDGLVDVNGRVVRRVSTRAAAGDVITVRLPDDAAPAPVLPEDGPLDRLYEDEEVLVVNKPAGLVSHPTYAHPAGSLLNILLWHAKAWPDGQRPSLVGRLDKLTSGIVVVAKTTCAHARLQGVLASSRSEKIYLAVAYGPMTVEHGEIALRLRRHPDDRRRVIASPDSGLASLTRVERLDQADVSGCCVALVACRLVTGRMHQIRVHLASSGWPLIGDAKYGEPRWQQANDEAARQSLRAFGRQALHAWRIGFTHPFSGRRVEVLAPIPPDLRDLIQACALRVPDDPTIPSGSG